MFYGAWLRITQSFELLPSDRALPYLLHHILLHDRGVKGSKVAPRNLKRSRLQNELTPLAFHVNLLFIVVAHNPFDRAAKASVGEQEEFLTVPVITICF